MATLGRALAPSLGPSARRCRSGFRPKLARVSGCRPILDVDELLFNGSELRLALEAQAKKMVDAVEAEPEESLKQADVDE
jgi:hypothetical protein